MRKWRPVNLTLTQGGPDVVRPMSATPGTSTAKS